ncbi:protein tramtrack, alpha isoform-like isoform X5 [Zootermopsis nevadensis]|uniref:protein tramtrack, alpha isoform-like isoform X5 n=1 Tax=Zootermopsis nevadensis TaxID=136037 RepID=UPI000B8E3BE1|nr:protein tramtrack, alpha isoform-like isoform X5 [Zootermopsis nevadensis]
MTGNRKNTSVSDFSTVKRSRKSVSLEIKYKIIKLADNGESNTKIAKKLELPRTTVVRIMKDKARILEEVKGQAPMQAKYIRQRAGLITKMEKLLIKWLDDQMCCHVPVSPAVIQAKARSLFENLKSTHGDGSQEETFQASKGWFQRFKSRFNLHNMEQSEATSVDEESARGFPGTLVETVVAVCVEKPVHVKTEIPDTQELTMAGPSCADTAFMGIFQQPRVTGSADWTVYQAPDLDVETVVVGSPAVRVDTPDEATWSSQEVPQQAPPGTKQVVAPPAPPPPPPVKKSLPLISQSTPKPAMSKPAPQPVSPPQPPPPPPEVCLRWNSYHSNMQATFPSLLSNEQFVDVTLACEGRSIKCHKVMLSACSSYFEELLSQNPCQHPIVLMKDLRFWEVQALVDFMYRGEVNVGQDNLPSLLAAAEALQIKGLAGPASTSSSHDEDSLPPSLALATDDYLDESTSSPSSARRARKRRTIASMPTLRQNTISPHRNPVGRPRLTRPSPQPSTSTYHLASVASEPPLRRARRSEPASLPVGEIKIEPVDIEISNDSMDPVDDGFDMNKTYDGSGGGDVNDSSKQGDEVGGDSRGTGGGGMQENSGDLSDDNMAITSGHDSDHMDYGNSTGMNSESTEIPTSGESKTKIQGYKYGEERTDNPGMSSSDMNPTYPEVVLKPRADSASSESILGHL